jgi:hypothetical protein
VSLARFIYHSCGRFRSCQEVSELPPSCSRRAFFPRQNRLPSGSLHLHYQSHRSSMQHPDGSSQSVAKAEELISRCTAHPITHTHTWLAPAFVREVRSLAHGMAGPTTWRARPPVSSLRDGSQDRSHLLRLRKRRQHHRGIWHVLTTLVTRWYVEPTLDLFLTSHSPSASSENKTQLFLRERTMTAESLLCVSQDRHTRAIPVQSVSRPY